MKTSNKALLLLCGSVLAYATPAAAEPAAADAVKAQTSSADSAGQANDANSLTTADIIVTGTTQLARAPSIASLTTTQPQAAVSRDFIENAAPMTSDFNDLAVLTPGVTLTGGNNGPGLGESKLSIRGFQDGEYNVTYDSIPFADTNNPTHHSTAFFPSNTIETLVVDRGPGNASQLGQATYGGNINLYSRAALDQFGVKGEFTYGSFRTIVGRAELQTGALDKLGGAKFVVTGQILDSHGALTFSPTHSKNIFVKGVIPIGDKNKLTLLATYNANVYYQSDTGSGTCGTGPTSGDITGDNCTTGSLAIYGRQFSMTNDPSVSNQYAQDYYKFNRTAKQTDFEIVRLQSEIVPGLTLDNRVYMYGYTNHTLSGLDATGQTANTVVLTPGGPATAGIPGYDKQNKYRTVGYIGSGDYVFSRGRIRVGGWYESADTDRHLIDYEMVTMQPNYIEKNVAGLTTQPPANVQYQQSSGWEQFQIFGELEYRPFEALSITPGVKYVHFTRSIDASVNQKSRTPINTAATWTSTLPFLTANLAVKSNWTFYFQFAKGMYVPDLSSFYSPSPSLLTSLDALQPQKTTNYQLGTVYHGHYFAFDGDVYLIDVNNKIAASTSDPTLLVNIGKVKYKGVEGQISVFPVTGLTLLANASYNQARSSDTGQQISKTPFTTGTLGAFYHHGPIYASYSQKFTGPQYGAEAVVGAPSRLYRMKPYSIGNASLAYDFGHFRLSVNVYNVFGNQQVNQIKTSSKSAPTTTVNGVKYQSGYGPLDQLLFNAPRSVQGTIAVKF
jgi:iron complex outermembrane receptor protein